MKLIKQFLTNIFYNLFRFFFIFNFLNYKNIKHSNNFKYLEKKEENIFFDTKNYILHNCKKRFSFLYFKNIKLINHYYYFKLHTAYAVSSGDYPIFLSRRFQVVLDSINLDFKYIKSSKFIKSFFKIIFRTPNSYLQNVICFSGSLDNNKFHWFIDYLPRLQYVIENNIQNKFIYIINKNEINHIRYYLNTIGIKNKNIIYWDEKNYLIKSLHIYSSRFLKYQKNKYEVYSLKSINWLHSYFQDIFKDVKINPKYKKILILRKKKDLRSILNESELVSFLKNYDYDTIYLENFSENEIIKIFKSAKTIITVHGAALSNIIFSKKIKIIEIYPSSFPEESAFVYYQLSRHLKFKHHVFFADETKDKKGLNININLFKKTLVNEL